ncbi:MAG: Ig domain-containing protein [Thermodesulfobacteriota bacterium]
MAAYRALRLLAAPGLVVALLVVALPLGGPVACGGCSVKIETESLPDGIVGVEYFLQLDSDCGGDEWFLDQGNLPPGIALSNGGKLTGTPLLAGVYTFTIGVVDYDDAEFAFRGFVMTVLDAGSA